MQSLFALHGLQYDENSDDGNGLSIHPAMEEKIAKYEEKKELIHGGARE